MVTFNFSASVCSTLSRPPLSEISFPIMHWASEELLENHGIAQFAHISQNEEELPCLIVPSGFN